MLYLIPFHAVIGRPAASSKRAQMGEYGIRTCPLAVVTLAFEGKCRVNSVYVRLVSHHIRTSGIEDILEGVGMFSRVIASL